MQQALKIDQQFGQYMRFCSVRMLMNLRDEVAALVASAPLPPGEPPIRSLDDVALASFADRVGTRIPPVLADWLRIANGAPVGPGGLFGIGTARRSLDIETYLKEYPEWLARDWFPVAGDGSGNYYVLSSIADAAVPHPVLYIDTHEDPAEIAYVVASDLWYFLRFLLRAELGEEGWPFSQTKVLHEDPAIALVKGAPYPCDQ